VAHDGEFDPSRLVEWVVSAERHRQLEEVLSYVHGIHHLIDPDMFDIPGKRLEDLRWCFQYDDLEPTGFTVTVCYDDLFWLQIITDAAYEYSLRKSTGRRAESLTNTGFENLIAWLADSERRLFRSPPPAPTVS
jgi:hypothetical protein